MTPITETQELLLKLIEKNSFNNFSGTAIARDLRANKILWRSALMTHFIRPAWQKLENPVTATRPPVFIYHEVDLLPLRHIPEDHYSADHLVIYAEPGGQERLEELAQPWNADATCWILGDEAFRAMGTTWRVVKDFTREDRVLFILWWTETTLAWFSILEQH